MAVFWVYLVLINLLAFLVSAADKYAARRGSGERVPERMLFTLAFLGGAAGLYSSMLLLRHKTKHRSFMLGVPLILLGETALVFFLAVRLTGSTLF